MVCVINACRTFWLGFEISTGSDVDVYFNLMVLEAIVH